MAIRRRWVAYGVWRIAVYKTEKKVCGIGETAVLLLLLLHHHAGTHRCEQLLVALTIKMPLSRADVCM